MNYQPFNDEWRKEVRKMTIPFIKNLIEGEIREFPKPNKAYLIELLRAELIVKQFNLQWPVSCTLYWRSVALEGFEYKEVTVKSKAYVANSGEPVAFFNEVSGYCSIAPEFVKMDDGWTAQIAMFPPFFSHYIKTT